MRKRLNIEDRTVEHWQKEKQMGGRITIPLAVCKTDIWRKQLKKHGSHCMNTIHQSFMVLGLLSLHELGPLIRLNTSTIYEVSFLIKFTLPCSRRIPMEMAISNKTRRHDTVLLLSMSGFRNMRETLSCSSGHHSRQISIHLSICGTKLAAGSTIIKPPTSGHRY